MNCKQPNVTLPVDFEGEWLNIQIGADGKLWVCIDGQSVLRAKGLSQVTVDDMRTPNQKRRAKEFNM